MLDKNLNISLFEYDIAWCNKQQNLNYVQKAFNAMPYGIDLLVLPEMFTTGFIVDKEVAVELAERNTQETISAIQQFADKYNVAICGSFLAKTASQLYNRAFFIEPNGDETFYDKRHLFRMGGEKETFNQGVTFSPIIRFRGWNIKIIICYDLRFPVWCRNDFSKNNYDVMLVISNWPKVRLLPWNTLLTARAIENECYTCGINRRGVDPNGVDYSENTSTIIDYKGLACDASTINIADMNGTLLNYSLSKTNLDRFKEKFPAWKDTDKFSIEL